MKELRKANTSEKSDVPEDIAYELQALSRCALTASHSSPLPPNHSQPLLSYFRDHSAIRYQLVMDVFDIWLPASNLGYVHVNEGLCGVFGYVASLSLPFGL